MPEVASAATEGKVGAARGQISLEFVAKLTQDAAAFSGFGYLTRMVTTWSPQPLNETSADSQTSS